MPFAGTVTGAACVFLLRDSLPGMLQKALLGFASGVMVAASVWSLLIPSIELSGAEGAWAVMPATVGFLAGMGFLLLLDHITPHLHLDSKKPEGPRSRLSRTSMLTLAVTLHNLPEGMAVGAVMAGVLTQSADLSAAGAIALSIGIAIQNIPEGAIISMPMLAEGNSKKKSFALGALSGIVEPLGAIITLLLAVKYIGGTLTSILGAMEPVTAVCIGALVFGEAFTLQEAFGIVLILVAVTLIILSKPIQHTLSSVFRMIRPRHA